MSLVGGKWIDNIWVYASASGDGSTTGFSLPSTPHSNSAVQVFVDGLIQRPTTDFSISGSTVTFVTAPANGQDILFHYVKKD